MRRIGVILLCGLWLGAPPTATARPRFADGPSLLAFSTGVAEIFDSQPELFWGVECRPAFRLFHIGPCFLFGTGKNNEFYAAVGVLADVELGRGWMLAPSFGAGYYNASSGVDLGFDAEFRTAVELAWRRDNSQRFGLCFAHLSNGSLGDRNPGTESLGISCSIPLDFLLRRAPAVDIPERTE